MYEIEGMNNFHPMPVGALNLMPTPIHTISLVNTTRNTSASVKGSFTSGNNSVK